MVHKPKHKVHSFRGLLGDGGQDEINLERSNVTLAYRIVKFEVFPNFPGTTAHIEHTVLIWREEQSSIPTSDPPVDFGDSDLLAAAYLADQVDTGNDASTLIVTFDNVLFSRNIFITNTDGAAVSGQSVNYYLELEEVSVNASTLMQLKLGVARKLNLQE